MDYLDKIKSLAFAGALALTGLEAKAQEVNTNLMLLAPTFSSETNAFGVVDYKKTVVATNTIPGRTYTLESLKYLNSGQNDGHFGVSNGSAIASSNSLSFSLSYNPTNDTSRFFKIREEPSNQ